MLTALFPSPRADAPRSGSNGGKAGKQAISLAEEDLAVLGDQVLQGLKAQLAGTVQLGVERLLREQEQRLLAALLPKTIPHGKSNRSGIAAGVPAERLRPSPKARSHRKEDRQRPGCSSSFEKFWLPWRLSMDSSQESDPPSSMKGLEDARDSALLSEVQYVRKGVRATTFTGSAPCAGGSSSDDPVLEDERAAPGPEFGKALSDGHELCKHSKLNRKRELAICRGLVDPLRSRIFAAEKTKDQQPLPPASLPPQVQPPSPAGDAAELPITAVWRRRRALGLGRSSEERLSTSQSGSETQSLPGLPPRVKEGESGDRTSPSTASTPQSRAEVAVAVPLQPECNASSAPELSARLEERHFPVRDSVRIATRSSRDFRQRKFTATDYDAVWEAARGMRSNSSSLHQRMSTATGSRAPSEAKSSAHSNASDTASMQSFHSARGMSVLPWQNHTYESNPDTPMQKLSKVLKMTLFSSDSEVVRYQREEELLRQISRGQRTKSPKLRSETSRPCLHTQGSKAILMERLEELLGEFMPAETSEAPDVALEALGRSRGSSQESPEALPETWVVSPLLLRLCGILPWDHLGRTYQWGILLLVVGLVFVFVDHFLQAQRNIMTPEDCPMGVCMHFGCFSDLVLAMGNFLGLLAMRKLTSLKLIGCQQALLLRSAVEGNLVRKWSIATSCQSLYLVILWAGSMAFRAGTVESDPDWRQLLHASAFMLSSLIFMGLVFSILHVSCCVTICIDAYTLSVSKHLNFTRGIQDWDKLGALLRRVSRAVDRGFLVVQTTAIAMQLCSFADLMLQGGQQIWWFMASVLLAQSLILIFAKAAEVTEMCKRVPALINTLPFKDSAFCPARHFLVEHITYSAAGFYVGEVRLTGAMALKLIYVSFLAAFAILTKLPTA